MGKSLHRNRRDFHFLLRNPRRTELRNPSHQKRSHSQPLQLSPSVSLLRKVHLADSHRRVLPSQRRSRSPSVTDSNSVGTAPRVDSLDSEVNPSPLRLHSLSLQLLQLLRTKQKRHLVLLQNSPSHPSLRQRLQSIHPRIRRQILRHLTSLLNRNPPFPLVLGKAQVRNRR
jgi:hypothetical protein